MTILAARRVLPPDLMVPADASAPRMNDTGPDAVPPPASSSLLERMRDRFTPAPEPPLKMMPSSRYQFRIESIESSTAKEINLHQVLIASDQLPASINGTIQCM